MRYQVFGDERPLTQKLSESSFAVCRLSLRERAYFRGVKGDDARVFG